MSPIDQFFATDSDAARYTVTALSATGILLAMLVAQIFHPLPWWFIASVMLLVVPRWMIANHELFHLRDYDITHPLVRLLPVPVTPFNLGYDEYRTLHDGHHKHPATPDDPDSFHIRGGHVLSLLGAMAFPEVSMVCALRTREVAIRWTDVGLRCLVFASLAGAGGDGFWLAWVWLRVFYGLSIWIFFHHLHYRQGKFGTFRLVLPGWLVAGLVALFGRTVVFATLFHDVHHDVPRVAARHLPAVAGGLNRS